MKNTTKEQRELSWAYFALLAAAALALRLFFVLRFSFLTPDSYIYGDIAKNWLLYHVYGLSAAAGPEATLIRLPGYPAILAAMFRLFGVDHYGSVLFLQVLVDLGTCFVTADLARRIVVGNTQTRAAKIAFALAALCPFLANYAAVALTETFAIFFAALALDLAIVAMEKSVPARAPGRALAAWTYCGLAIAASILLRPDGGMLLVVIGGAIGLQFLRAHRPAPVGRQLLGALAVLAVASLAPLAPWTARNWRTFHVFQPLVPFAANSPGEFVAHGFDRWERTWLVDYASVEDIAWRPDGDPMDVSLVPARAFDDEPQRQQVAALFALYNQGLKLTPDLDRQFAEIAAQRVRRHPVQFYLLLPLARAMDMWLRPRTEMLPITPHWWWFDDPVENTWALIFAAIGIWYAGVSILGMVCAPRPRYLGLLLGFVVFRTLFIAYTTMPEPRYVLECYPVIIAFAAAALARFAQRGRNLPAAT